MLVSLLPPAVPSSSSRVLPLLLFLLLLSSQVFISLLLQSAPLALPSSSYFFFPFIFHAAKANACIMRGTGLLAVPSESNDLRERPSNRSTQEKGAEANGEPAASQPSRKLSCIAKWKPFRFPSGSFCTSISFSEWPAGTYSGKLKAK